MDYFTLFGLPIRYDVDGGLLASRFQALQHAATINSAYQALKHPLKRVEYLLSLHGFDLNNEQHTAFLMEQLELREALEAIPHRADADEALAAFAARLQAMTATRHEQMRYELDNEAWAAVADTVRKLRFLDKLQQQVEKHEEQLLDR